VKISVKFFDTTTVRLQIIDTDQLADCPRCLDYLSHNSVTKQQEIKTGCHLLSVLHLCLRFDKRYV